MVHNGFLDRVVWFTALGVASFGGAAYATVTQSVVGFSASGDPVDFAAELSIVGDTLTVQLFNNSPAHSTSPDDLLSSFFFDVVNSTGNRPPLTYTSAFGDVWLTNKSAPDLLQTAQANLKAVNPGDHTWQFRALDAALTPFLGFGVGTVGNANLAPNNFHGNIVGGFDYSIYAGDVTTQSLHGYLLVKPSATFTFSGLAGFTEADISGTAAFGMGTLPDGILWTPEPSTSLLLSLSALALLRRRYLNARPKCPRPEVGGR